MSEVKISLKGILWVVGPVDIGLKLTFIKMKEQSE
jgi:hypothetical protein